MEKRFIYATNRSLVIYKFVIIDETETEYVVNDANTTCYELSQVKFYINKDNLCNARCEKKKWAFIVTEDFFASFELKDVEKEFYKRRLCRIKTKRKYSTKEGEITELMEKIQLLPNKNTKKAVILTLEDITLLQKSVSDKVEELKSISKNSIFFKEINKEIAKYSEILERLK